MSWRDGYAAPVNGAQRERVLVTGAAGFGGSNLVKRLLEHDYMVTALDIVPSSHADLLSVELADPNVR